MASGAPQVILQPRDIALLRGLFESRVMTIEHAADLYFDGKQPYTKKRLQRLDKAGYLKRRVRKVGERDAVFFTKKAYRMLRDGGHLEGLPRLRWEHLEKRSRVSELTLRHELDVMSVKAAMSVAMRGRDDLTVKEFSTWPRLSQFRALRHRPKPGEGPTLLLKPDGFLRVEQSDAPGMEGKSEMYFYLEVDRSTETLETVLGKMLAYRDHHTRGGLPAKYGRPRSEWKQWPFRVLWTFRSGARLANAAETFLSAHPPIRGLAWLTTFERAVSDPLGPVWRRPQDGEGEERGVISR